MTQKRAVLYLRLSSSDEASTAIVRQEADLRGLAEREGWEVARVLTDDGISGRKSRANAAEALRMIRDGDADVLAVWAFDRWSRQGLGTVADLIATLDARPDALFVAYTNSLRSDQSAWRLIAGVLAEVARMEAENTSKRVKSSIKKLRTSGRFSGGTVPFGYRSTAALDGPGRILQIDEQEAAIVREVASRVLDGESISRVAGDLNARHVPTAGSAARRARQAGQPIEGLATGSWQVVTLRTLLTGDFLLGRVIHDGKPVLGDDGLPVAVWAPILDLATLTRLRARFGDPRSPSPALEPRRRQARLLSGLVYCAHCDKKCFVKSAHGRPIYSCQNALKGPDACPVPRITADGLESYVTATFLDVFGATPELVETERVNDAGASEELAEVTAALAEVGAALTDDDADTPALLARMTALKARRAELRSIPSSIEVTATPTGRTIAEAWAEEDDLDKKRSLLLLGIDHLTIAATGKRGGPFDPAKRVRILWNS